MDAPLWGDTGGHTGTAPTNLHHIFPRNPTQTKYHLCVIHPNEINRPTGNPPNESNRSHAQSPKRNRRGGAYVPARTSAQRRFHPKMRCCHPQMLRFHLRKTCFHLQTRCFHPRKASLTMDAPSRGELAGKQVRPLPHLTTTSATFLQNHSSFRNERKAEHRSYHLPC